MQNTSLVGRRFGLLVVTSLSDKRTSARCSYVHCTCDCGNTKEILKKSVLAGKSTSCGCRGRAAKPYSVTHKDGSRTRLPEYTVWTTMKARCYNASSIQYKDYGGRGISICDQWRNDFAAFYRDMGPRPTRHHSIDRIDNDGHYELANCRWTIRLVQCRNKRNTKRYELDGVSKTLAEFSEDYGIDKKIVKNRVKKLGWPLHRALTTQPRS